MLEPSFSLPEFRSSSAEIFSKYRCSACHATALERKDQSLRCAQCGSQFPVRAGRFIDFLTQKERDALSEELAFWDAHFQNKEYQDESELSYQNWIKNIPSSPEKEILEIGCGSGALLRRLPAKLRVGLEPAENLLHPSSGFSGVIGNAHNLPFRDDSFDLVLFKHALHHVQDKRKGFEEAVRVLRPAGQLVIIEPNAIHPQRRLISNPKSWLRRAHILTRFIGPVETFQPMDQLIQWAEELGLDTVQAYYSESQYDRLTVRQGLQRVYSSLLKPFVEQKYLLPNYFVSFQKSRAHA